MFSPILIYLLFVYLVAQGPKWLVYNVSHAKRFKPQLTLKGIFSDGFRLTMETD